MNSVQQSLLRRRHFGEVWQAAMYESNYQQSHWVATQPQAYLDHPGPCFQAVEILQEVGVLVFITHCKDNGEASSAKAGPSGEGGLY